MIDFFFFLLIEGVFNTWPEGRPHINTYTHAFCLSSEKQSVDCKTSKFKSVLSLSTFVDLKKITFNVDFTILRK